MSAVRPVEIPTTHESNAGGPDAEAGLARRALYYMVLMREVEDRIERKLYRQGKVVGGVYVGRGQEAISVGGRDIPRTTAAIDDAVKRLSRLFAMQLMLNAVFGAVIGAGLWLIGIPNALL